jgi:hypothetical protein
MVFVDKEGSLAGCKMLAEGIFCSAEFLFLIFAGRSNSSILSGVGNLTPTLS